MKKEFLVGLIALLVLVGGCTVPTQYVCSDGSTALAPSDCPAAETPDDTGGQQETLPLNQDEEPGSDDEPPADDIPIEVDFKIVSEDFFCELAHYSSSFGVELYNRGTENVPDNAVIKLILENDASTYDYVRGEVEPGKRFWQSQRSARAGFMGRTFSLNTGMLGEVLTIGYWFVYCEPGVRPIDCGVDNGLIIIEGNTEDCEVEGYFT
tara:strand:- start:692 stop:1318 length:627 start_codon:yes stop_codon:yes gene_type:complete